MHSFEYTAHANIPLYLALDPENSLDNAAAEAEVVTAATDRVSPSGAQGKRSLRPARNDHQEQRQENQLVYSRNFPMCPFFVINICYHHVC
jgi:hypothetical protein